MQKTKLGITVGLLGAITYFAGLISGILALAIIAGYVLLNEENEWLKKAVVKAVVLYITFAAVGAVIGLIPSAVSIVESAFAILHIYIDIPLISSLCSLASSVVNWVEDVLFIVLGLKALNQGTIAVPVVDDLVNKYI